MEIDVEALLAPVSEDNPVGADLDGTPERYAIEEPFQLEAGAEGGDELEIDWRDTVRRIVVQFAETKDLWLATYLMRAGAQLGSSTWWSVGRQAAQGLVDRYWDTVHPQLEMVDFIGRKAPFEVAHEAAVQPAEAGDPGPAPAARSLHDRRRGARMAREADGWVRHVPGGARRHGAGRDRGRARQGVGADRRGPAASTPRLPAERSRIRRPISSRPTRRSRKSAPRWTSLPMSSRSPKRRPTPPSAQVTGWTTSISAISMPCSPTSRATMPAAAAVTRKLADTAPTRWTTQRPRPR
ncbi:type VI secretion system ImpA family N-terminal domain-containing protein [Sphingomonas sp. MMS24-JH45]